MVLSAFMPSVTGMNAQAHAMGTVSSNIANMRTVGYKSADTQFYSLLGSQPIVKGNPSTGLQSSRVDISGVGYYDRTGIDKQGIIAITGNPYDVAINGTGNAFFVLSDPSGKQYYTRAGDFNTRSENDIPHLVSKNGLYLQGFKATSNGVFEGGLSNITIDYPNRVPSVETTKFQLVANVPSTGVDRATYGLTFYGQDNDGKNVVMVFNKVDSKVNTWEVSFVPEDGVTTSPPVEVIFDNMGQLLSPWTTNVEIAWADGTTNAVEMDLSKMTQFNGSSSIQNIWQDGMPSGNFLGGFVGQDGVVRATYSNGFNLDYAKIALVGFVAPNNLIPTSGTMFEASAEAGGSYYLIGHDTVGGNYISPESVENSTTNIEESFATMIMVQRAYALNSKSFTSNNEMIQLAVNLKS